MLMGIDHGLDGKKDLAGNDARMMAFLPVLVSVLPILFRFVVEVVGGVGLAGKDISAMLLVFQDAIDVTCCPLRGAVLPFASKHSQEFGDLLCRIAAKKKVEADTNGVGLILIDDEIPILVLAEAKKLRQQENAAGKTLLDGDVHNLALGAGLLLCGGRKDGQNHLAGVVQRVNVFCLKEYAYGVGEVGQFPDNGNAIYQVPGESAHRFRYHQVYGSSQSCEGNYPGAKGKCR